MAAILDFTNMVAPWGARQKSKQYDMGDLWAKLGAFGRIWTKISQTLLTNKQINIYKEKTQTCLPMKINVTSKV